MSTSDLRDRVDAPTDGRSRATVLRVVLVLILVALASTLVSAVYLEPIVTGCETTVLGGPGDATAGSIWQNWAYENSDARPWPSRTDLTAAPNGEPSFLPSFVSQSALLGSNWAISQVTGPVCAYNISVIAGFVLTATAMFALVWWITGSAMAASFAAFAYSFSPFRMAKAQGQVGLLHVELIVLMVLAILAMWRRPRWPFAVLAGLALGATAYVDGYVALFGVVTYVALAAGLVISSRRGGEATLLKPRLAALFGGLAVAGAVILPEFVYLRSRGAGPTSGVVSRASGEATTYGARLWEYVFPARTNPLTRDLFGGWLDNHLHGSNFSETTLYLGWVVIILAVIAVGSLVLHRARRSDRLACGLRRGVVVGAFTSVLAVGFLVSLPGTSSIFGLEFPGLSLLVINVTPYWRVFSRFFVVVHLGVVVLAALGLVTLLRGRRPAIRALMFVVLCAVLVAEFLPIPPRQSWSYSDAPPAYAWVGRQSDIDTIAEYPLYAPSDSPHGVNGDYFTFQPIHGKRMVNVRYVTSPQAQRREGIFGLADQQTVPVLRALGADAVIAHPDRVGVDSESSPSPDLELVASYPGAELQGANVYRIRPGPSAPALVSPGAGFSWNEHLGWQSLHHMGNRATLRVTPLNRSVREVIVSFDATSTFGEAREIIVRQRGAVLARQSVSGTTRLEFVASTAAPIKLFVPGRADRYSKRFPGSLDHRRITVGVSNLGVRDVP